MEAQTLKCPNCGAAISSDSPQCKYCESKLATIACASCFGMMFIGSKHCPHCGAVATEVSPTELSILKCPRCKTDMISIEIAGEQMRECEHCGGIWLDVASFERICASREEQSAVLGAASPAPTHQINPTDDGSRIRYSPCPQCGELMNRINFARTWFDASELRAIVEFVRGGGLELSREREKSEIKYEREQLRAEQNAAANRMNRVGFHVDEEERVSGLSAARGLLEFLID